MVWKFRWAGRWASTPVLYTCHRLELSLQLLSVSDMQSRTSSLRGLGSALGGQYDCGTTDVTRTFHMGKPSDYQKLCFTRVLQVRQYSRYHLPDSMPSVGPYMPGLHLPNLHSISTSPWITHPSNAFDPVGNSSCNCGFGLRVGILGNAILKPAVRIDLQLTTLEHFCRGIYAKQPVIVVRNFKGVRQGHIHQHMTTHQR